MILRCALSCSAVYCNCLCLFVCLFVGLLPRKLEIACVDLHQTGSVGEGSCSDHLQLITFWPSCVPGKGGCGGVKFFFAPPYYSQHAVFASPLSGFFHLSMFLCVCVPVNLSLSVYICTYVISVLSSSALTTATRNFNSCSLC